jgi:hypothetical protein
MMGAFMDALTRLNPLTGRMINSSGEAVNVADAVGLEYRYSLLRQTVENGAVEMTKRVQVSEANSANPLYFALDIPEGRRFYIWNRDLRLTQGRYTVDLVRFPSGFTGGVDAFSARLYQNGADTVTTALRCNVTPVNPGEGVVVAELPLVDTGTTVGQARAAGAASIDGALKSYTGDGDPVLIRVQRTESGAYTASILLIAWEEAE